MLDELEVRSGRGWPRRMRKWSVVLHNRIYKQGRAVAWLAFAMSIGLAYGGLSVQGFTLKSSITLVAETLSQRLDRECPPYEARGSVVRIDRSVLLDASASQKLVFNLFDDLQFIGTIDYVGRTLRGVHVCKGSLDHQPDSSFSLFTTTDGLVGSIRVNDEQVIRIRPTDGNLHLIQILKAQSPLKCGLDHVEPQAAPRAVEGADPLCDGNQFLDVLVVYTPLAKADAGGAQAIESEIEYAIGLANEAFDRSLIEPRLQVVHIAEIEYDESGVYVEHLERLTNPDDGFFDSVHALRDEYHADIVTMLVADEDEFCGLAWLMDELTPAFEASAFNVVTWWCAADYSALVHEIGHNVGCHHDHDNAKGKALFPYSYGHRFLAGTILRRTLMAYEPGTLIQNFSNPQVPFGGAFTGVPGEGPDAADNARTVNETASLVANFRCGQHCGWPIDKMFAGDGEANDAFGTSVAMDGDTIVIGAPEDNDGAISNKGSAYVFELNGFQAELKQKIVPPALANHQAGFSVAIWNDVIVLGAPDFGAHVFRFDGASWIHEQALNAPIGFANYGGAVAAAQDVVVIGSSDEGNLQGAVYVYRHDGSGTWNLEQKLTASDGAPLHRFGQAVSIWNDLILVGSKIASTKGAAYAFRKVGKQWIQEQKLLASDGADFDDFAHAVSLRGNLALIGAPQNDDQGGDSGSAYVFEFDGNTWVQKQKLLPADGGADDRFGRSCALHGAVALVGSPQHDTSANSTGAAYVFREQAGAWTQTRKITAIEGLIMDYLGSAVALDGDRAVIGSPDDNVRTSNSGSAYLAIGLASGDCNRNGANDACDIADLDSLDRNDNLFPDECEPVPGDVNGDLLVNVDDLLAVVNSWGVCKPPRSVCAADLTGNGVVDVDDLMMVINNWSSM